MKKFASLILSGVVSFSACAVTNPPAECDLGKEPLEKDVSLGGKVPEYFFKPIWSTGANDTRDEVSLIADSGNLIMDMRNGNMRSIPGPYDGVPTPDGHFIVAPEMQFYDRDTVKENSEPLYDDALSESPLSNVYHSLGVLSATAQGRNKQVTYRAITDTATGGGNLYYKEYTFSIAPDGTKKLVSTNGEPKEICSNLGTTLRTPILAKNGQMLSAYSTETGTSIIYDVVKVGGRSECKVKKDMGFATSKMEFSADGSKVVFAMNSLQTTPGDVEWYAQPPTDSHNMNVFTYNLASNDLTRISKNEKGNAYYPSFSGDGKSVVWMNQSLDDNGQTSYSIRRMKEASGRSMKGVDFAAVRGCNLDDPSVVKLMALGKLWESVCSELDEGMTLSALSTIPLGLSPDNCQKLVNNNWDSFSQNAEARDDTVTADMANGTEFSSADAAKYMKMFTGLTKEDVLGTCQAGTAERAPAARAAAPRAAANETNHSAVPTESCVQCHGATNTNAPHIPFDNPAALGPYKRSMLLQVMSGNMPKNMPLTPEARERLIDYLRDLPDAD